MLRRGLGICERHGASRRFFSSLFEESKVFSEPGASAIGSRSDIFIGLALRLSRLFFHRFERSLRSRRS